MNAGGAVAGQVAEVLVGTRGAYLRRGSGYRIAPGMVLTAAHVIDGIAEVEVRFDADLPTEWIAKVVSVWSDRHFDLAVLTIVPRDGEAPVVRPRFGRVGDGRPAVVKVHTVGFPLFKLRHGGPKDLYRESHQADGTASALSNRRTGTLEVRVPAPAGDPDPDTSPWEGMSGAAVWAGERIVGVVVEHHRAEGLGRLTAARLDHTLAGLGDGRRAELRGLLGLPDELPDVIPLPPGERVLGAYRDQARYIAPDKLLDREAELDELVAFCAGDLPYAWWQAGPWAGKTALMSWFVAHPPAGVDTVSFFVTAQLANQSDRDACATALIHQLAALTGESPDTLLLPGTQESTLLRLLADAASRAREAGRRVLVVIDGLDEDRGTGGSIAGLLPRRPPPGLRVVVAGRPDPPLPDDVSDDHPLRSVGPRRLDVATRARDLESTSARELNLLLSGDDLERQVLGLITAAGGGLTLTDLEDLTGRSRFELEPLLSDLFGDTFGSRIAPGPEQPDERVYLFAHETLRLSAEERLRPDLAGYRDQLHEWAQTYAWRGWPADTPQYLLRGYSGMLAGVEDHRRLVTCGTDRVRHDRMRAVTGGDDLAFAEIGMAQRLILAQPDPDLTVLVRLTTYRDQLTGRYTFIPDELPAVWARIGRFGRAEALISSISDVGKRMTAWCALVKAVAEHDREQAARWADEAETFINQSQLADLSRAPALGSLAEAVAAGGDRERAARLVAEAEMLAGDARYPGSPTWKLAELAAAVVGGGDSALVARLADEAEGRVRRIAEPMERVGMTARLIELAGRHGDHGRAARLTGEAETVIGQITELAYLPYSLRELVAGVAAGGDPERAGTLARRIDMPSERALALSRIAAEVPAGWLIAEADALDRQAVDPAIRLRVLPWLVETVAACGDHDRAVRWAGEVHTLIRQTGNTYQESLMGGVATALATVGEHDFAERLAEQVVNRVSRAWALIRLAKVVAAQGDHDRAARLLTMAEERDDQIDITGTILLTHLAEAMAIAGDPGRTALVADAVEALIARETDLHTKDMLLPELASAMAEARDFDRAEALIWQMGLPEVHVLIRLVGLVADGGDHDRVYRLAGLTESYAGGITDLLQRVNALTGLAVAVAPYPELAGRLYGSAYALMGHITDRAQWESAMAGLVSVVAITGDHQRAEALTLQIGDPLRRVSALAGLAKVAAKAGDPGRSMRLAGAAQALFGQIPGVSEDDRLWVFDRLIQAAGTAGDHARAEALIAQLHDPRIRAEALARLAGTFAEVSRKSEPARGLGYGTPRLMNRARHLMAQALVTGSWTTSPGVLITTSWGLYVIGLAQVSPEAAVALADDLRARWNLDAYAAETAQRRSPRGHGY